MSFQAEFIKGVKEKRWYFVGDQLPTDWNEAFTIWMAYAQKGNANAQYNIGRCYDIGNGVSQDLEQANSWYLKSAEQGDPQAYFSLSLLHENATFMHHDTNAAKDYLDKAVKLGAPYAAEHHRKLYVEPLEQRLSAYLKERNKLLNEVARTLCIDRDIEKAKKQIKEGSPELTSGWANQVLAALDLIVTPNIQRIADPAKREATYRGTIQIKNPTTEKIVAGQRENFDLGNRLEQGISNPNINATLVIIAASSFNRKGQKILADGKQSTQIDAGETDSVTITNVSFDRENELKCFLLIVEDTTVAHLSDNAQQDLFALSPPLNPTLKLEPYSL